MNVAITRPHIFILHEEEEKRVFFAYTDAASEIAILVLAIGLL